MFVGVEHGCVQRPIEPQLPIELLTHRMGKSTTGGRDRKGTSLVILLRRIVTTVVNFGRRIVNCGRRIVKCRRRIVVVVIIVRRIMTTVVGIVVS